VDEGSRASSGFYDFLRIKILFISIPSLLVVVVGGILQPVIEATLMVFFVLIDVLNKRHDFLEI
jgi:hypothetical protein